MPRLTPAAPALFFLGLALLCGAMAEYARWPLVHGTADGSDFVMTSSALAAAVTGPDLVETALRWGAQPDSLQVYEVVERVAAGAVAVALVGLLLVALRRRLAGALLLGAAIVFGAATFTTAGLQVRLLPYMRFVDEPCQLPSPTQFVNSPELLWTLTSFAAAMALLVGAAWLLAQRQTGQVRWSSALAAAIGLAMVAVPYVHVRMAMDAIEEASRHHAKLLMPGSPAWLVALLLAAGVALALRRPLYSSRLVSALAFSMGLLAVVPAVAVAHDEAVDVHWPRVNLPIDFASVQARTCGEVVSSPLVRAVRGQVSISGTLVGEEGSVEEELAEQLADQRRKFLDLHQAAGERTDDEPGLNVLADRGTPLGTVREIAAAQRRVGGRHIDVIAAPTTEDRLWTRPAFHAHVCSLRIELSDDGVPLSSFADWQALVSAADRAHSMGHQFKLRVNAADRQP